MLTYQDLLAVGESDTEKMDFAYRLINNHKSSEEYNYAKIAEAYFAHKNVTIYEFQKLLYTVTGEAIPDNYSANYKLASNFFYRFITQQNQYLLGNGINWNEDNTDEKLGEDFDQIVQEIGREALICGVAFGFWNFDHLDKFSLLEFAPLFDEETGALMAGVRFWQIDDSKPLRATLYEIDGYTDYIWNRRTDAQGKTEEYGEILNPKRSYQQIKRSSAVDGTEIVDGENYEGFPIVPLYGNPMKQSELIGIREQIDAYDLIKSGFANTVDEASLIYWTINNAGGMDDIDLVKFVDHIKTVKAAVVEDNGARAESHSIEAPYASREALLDRLRADLYEDFMALDTKNLASGAVTATQIEAAYEPINAKTDLYEYQITAFIREILKLAGIDDKPTYTRSVMVNKQEEITVLTQAATYLPEEYLTEKILTILGDVDKLEDVKAQMQEEDINRMPVGESEVDDGLRTQGVGQETESTGEQTE